MGSKYTTNSISGYNATPPSDDGTQSTANKVKWSTIKNKLTDPTKTLAEAIDTDLTTYANYGPTTLVSAALTLGAAHHNQFIDISGAATPTLNEASALGAGWFCDVKNTGGSVITMARTDSGDTIDGVTADVTIGPLDYIRFVVNAAATGFVTAGARVASSTQKGQIEIATQAEVDAGTSSTLAVTPATLNGYFPPSVSDFDGGQIVYLKHGGFSGTALTVTTALTVSAVESIGPTGSGADNIWASMDVIPLTATAVILEVLIFNGGTITVSGYDTSTITIAPVGYTGLTMDASGYHPSGGTYSSTQSSTKFITLNASNVFNAQWTETLNATGSSTTIYFWIRGFVE